MRRSLGLILAAGLVAAGPGFALPESLSTQAERSGYQRTGRYAEVPALCQAFTRQWPDWVRWETFGTTPEGRPMLALVVSKSGVLQPEAVKMRSLPVLLMQGGIHAGEIDGKDAGFLALREILDSDAAWTKNLVIVFVPVFNVDGHERWGAWNRPNQVGPEEMGWRVTSQNLNLNRDYAKADSPEMLAMLGLLQKWDPIVYADLHVTDGAQFQPDVAVLVEPKYVGDPTLARPAGAMQRELLERLEAQGSMPLDFYPSFRDYSDPASGFSDGAYTPRFSTGYWPLRNRIGVLVETHSWKDYPTRVRTTRNVIMGLAELTARDGQVWQETAAAADQAARELGGKPVSIAFKTAEEVSTTLEFPGYAYRKVSSPISGGQALIYDPQTPEVWRIPFYQDVRPSVTVTAPRGGYLIPAGQAAWMAPRLTAHGITFRTLEQALQEQPVQVFRADKVTLATKSTEGHQTATLSGTWTTEPQSLEPGSLFVPTAQTRVRLVMALLEPQAPDSFAAWGFFNAHFEQKEYMEEYVAEQVAAEMLAARPEIKAEFERRLAEEPEFAKSPEARLEFFYRHHPSWDSKLNLYPVMRTDIVPSKTR